VDSSLTRARTLVVVLATITSLLILEVGLVLTGTGAAEAIPPFARRYGVTCQTCHVIIPKLNEFGEAFRLNGYQIAEDDEIYVRDEPLQLGAEPWRDLFPEAIWPGDIPGLPPLGLRFISDVQWTASAAGIDGNPDTRWSFIFPAEVELLTGGRLGDSIGFFGEIEWKQNSAVEIEQAYLHFDVAGPVNLRIGLMDPQLLLQHDDTTRVGKQHPLWGSGRLSDWQVDGFGSSPNTFRLRDPQAGIELNTLIGRRFMLGAGLVNGSGNRRFDADNGKDVYVKAKLKILGRDFHGTGPEPQHARGKPMANYSVLLEGFGYWGSLRVDGTTDRFRYVGGGARLLVRDLDLSVGLVRGRHDNPWFTSPQTGTDGLSWYARADYTFYPWLLGRVLYEQLEWDEPAGGGVGTGYEGSLDQERIVFGPVASVRANLRVLLEAELYTRHRAAEVNGLAQPSNVWVRIDYVF